MKRRLFGMWRWENKGRLEGCSERKGTKFSCPECRLVGKVKGMRPKADWSPGAGLQRIWTLPNRQWDALKVDDKWTYR